MNEKAGQCKGMDRFRLPEWGREELERWAYLIKIEDYSSRRSLPALRDRD